MFGLFKRKKKKYPESAKYQLGDFVNFRYLNELYFGYIYDAEIDENEDGTSYLVDLFEYQKECYLAIRIDAETYSKIRIVAGYCDSYNLLNSVGYLLIVS